MIDLHSHLLPGIDDGPATVSESLAMARRAVEGGTATVVCTPHMLPRTPVEPARVHEGVRLLRDELRKAEIPLEVLPGAEISLDVVRRMGDGDLAASSLGGNGRWVLLEMPFTGWPLDLGRILDDLDMRGFSAVLAHPERADSLQRQPDRLRDAIGRGALTQITASSLTGEHGLAASRTARTLLRNGWVHFIASDSHSADWRNPDMRDGVAAAAEELSLDVERISWMVQEGPSLVLEGAAIRPPRLARATSR